METNHLGCQAKGFCFLQQVIEGHWRHWSMGHDTGEEFLMCRMEHVQDGLTNRWKITLPWWLLTSIIRTYEHRWQNERSGITEKEETKNTVTIWKCYSFTTCLFGRIFENIFNMVFWRDCIWWLVAYLKHLCYNATLSAVPENYSKWKKCYAKLPRKDGLQLR